MEFIVSKQIAVNADTPEEAVAKSVTEGQVISLNCSPRPQAFQPPAPVKQPAKPSV